MRAYSEEMMKKPDIIETDYPSLYVINLHARGDQMRCHPRPWTMCYMTKRSTLESKGSSIPHFPISIKRKMFFLGGGDRFWAGKCLLNMAIIMTGEGDFYGALETSLEAIHYFDADQPDHAHFLASNYNNLGIASYQLKSYEDALKFYRTALSYSTDSLELSSP